MAWTMAALMLAEVVAGAPRVGPVVPAPGASPACDPTSTEIVVCARKTPPDQYRLRALPDMPEQTSILPRADFRLFGNVRGSLDAQQRSVGGFPSNAIMATVRIPF